MNKISRLTALLLALMMIFSTFAAAETTYSVGGMTAEQWQQLVDDAESELFGIDEGDSGKTITPESPEQAERGDYYPYADGVTLELADEAVSCQISASGVAILTNASAGQWQMKIGSSWVNIAGETGATLSVTGAMMNGMTTAEVRKALGDKDETTGEYTEYTAAATVEIVETAPALLSVNRADVSTEENTGEEVVLPYSLQRANEGTTMYTVVVEYKFENGTTAAGSWGASVGAGTNLNETVPNPNVVGYKPKTTVVINPADAIGITYTPATVAAADDAANGIKIGDVTDPGSVNLAITGIDQHITVTVTYEPTLVDYTVIHKQQNTDNDNYTEVERVTERGLTGSVVPDNAIARSYPGFYSLLYEQPTIAANGSTVVEISYDRYYYLISFELFGGYGVDPVYGRFGAAVGEVGTPIRAGYTFKGWATTQEKAEAGTVDVTSLPTTIPAVHTTYYAVWETVKATTVTIVYWGENANDEGYSYISSETVNAKPGASHTYTNGTPGTLWCPLEENHQHSDACGLTCTIEAHTHSIADSCYTITCGYGDHVHTDECYTCTHEHGTSCYSVSNNGVLEEQYKVDENKLTYLDNGIYTRKEGKNNTSYYVKIGNKWYRANRSYNGEGNNNTTYVITYNCQHTCDEACLDCNGHVHSETCYTLTCTKPIHIHDASCYDCGYVEHAHDDACYVQGPGLDSNLWTFVRSDTVTVAADGSTVINVYYDRTTFTLEFYTDEDKSEKVYEINAKWGANIVSHWPIIGTDSDGNKVEYDNGERWMPRDSDGLFSYVLVQINVMPAKSFWLYVDASSYNPYTMHYMVEALPGETENTVTGTDGRTYRQWFEIVAQYNYVTKDEDWFDLEGFTQTYSDPAFDADGTYDNGDNGCDVYFYYARNNYNITFNNGETDIKTDSVAFEASLAGYADYTLTKAQRPSAMEEGSVEFAGWYLNPECSDDAKVDFADSGDGTPWTMPASNMIVYAKWVPVTYKVRFFLNEDLMKTGLDENAYTPTLAEGKQAIFEDIPHGTQIDQKFVDAHLDYNAMTANGGIFYPYTFVAWFYYDQNGVKQPFEPKTQIKQNLDVFAEWSSDVLVPYTIKYAVPKLDEDGNRVVDYYVAADTTGYALAGTSKTFEAKGGADLFADYQTGCFPETESHTLRFETEDATNGVEYIFWYTDEVKVPYTVYYVTETQDADNSLNVETIPGVDGTYYRLKDPKTVLDNENAIVTETFETVSGYMPDAYQKRLIVTDDGNSNNDVIIFIYTKDEVHAYYRVTHYIENLDTDASGNTTWTEYTSSQFVGEIGVTKEYNDDKLTISGFEFSHETYAVGNTVNAGSPDNVATLTEDGMQINLYYTRKEYPYKVQYLLENTTTELASAKNGVQKYEKTVTENALTIENYELVSADPQSLTIRIEEDANGNILTEPKLNIITFYYREKTVTINYEAVGPENAQNFGTVNPEQEQLGILNGVATGSVATAGEHYTFDGWYSDQACTTLLTKDARYVPTKEQAAAWVDGTTWYAKFQEKKATINYVVVGPTGCGTVVPESETINVVTGVPAGSTASANANYTFVGWYSDAECTTLLTDAVKYVPTKAEEAVWIDGTTYYAKFEYLPGQLDITKTVVNNTGMALTVTEFTFTVTLKDSENNPLTGNVTYRINDQSTTVPLTDGAFSLTLDVGEMDGSESETTRTVSASILSLPHGTKFTVTEATVDNCTITYTGENGEIEANQTKTASFTNTFPANPDSTLTVKKEGMQAGETAIFKVVVDGKTFMLALSSTNPSDTIVDLPIDSSYTVTELNAWTWRYDDQTAKTGQILKDGSTVTFTNTTKADKWLHDESSVINNVTDGSVQNINNQ